MGLVREKHRQAEKPHEAFDSDLVLFLANKRNKGREVLYMEHHISTTQTESVNRFFQRYEMANLMPADAPPTCIKSSLESPLMQAIFDTNLFERSMESIGIYPQ